MAIAASFFTRSTASECLSRLCGLSDRSAEYGIVPLSQRQIRTLAQNGIVRPLYAPSTAGDSALYGLEELALLYLWVRLERAGIPYVRRALTLERVGSAVREAVRRPASASGRVIVFDRLGGRVLSAGERTDGEAAYRESVAALARRVSDAAAAFSATTDVWSGHGWQGHADVAAQLCLA